MIKTTITHCFIRAIRDTIREIVTATTETGREKAAPVSIDGAGAAALSWADTQVATERTAATKVIIIALEKQMFAISQKIVNKEIIQICSEKKWENYSNFFSVC